MKKAISLVGVLGLLLAAGSALAQNGRVQANVPFGFTVNEQMLPAGAYTITPSDRSDTVLLVRGDGQSAIVLAQHAQKLQAPDKTKLVFRCYGGSHYFLSEIWTAGNSLGKRFPKTSLENELASNLKPDNIVVYAALR
jgi:hypothetical protein